MENVFQQNFFINVNAGIQFNDKKINRRLKIILALLNTMTNFSTNTYISAEQSINHLQSKINDKKAYISLLNASLALI